MTARDAEQLGILLNQPPYTGQTDDLRRFLSNFELSILPRLINSRIRRYTGQTPVHLAATNGLIECLEILLKSGGDPNVQSSPTDLCQTPLHLAARKGYVKSLQLLLEYGARFDVENTHRETPMQLARGKKNCEKVFEHAIAKYQIPLRTKEEEAVVEELHTCVDDNLERFYFLYGQLSSDRQDLATRWTDFYEQTLLYRATVSEQYDAVKYLLSRSSNQPLHNLNTFDTPLLVACLKKNHRIVQLLLNHSPRLLFLQDARNKRSALHIACSNCDIEMLNLLLDYVKYNLRHSDIDENNKFSLDFLDILNRTPLFNACYYSFLEGVKRLLEFQNEYKRLVSLDVNAAVEATRRTPLHVAVRRGKTEIIQLLLDTKRVDVSLEARPSKDTHKRLLHSIQKKLHGRVIPMQESIDYGHQDDDKLPNSVSSSSTGNPVSPTSWTAISSPNSSVFDGDTPNSGTTTSNPSSQKGYRKISGDRRFTGVPENREAVLSPDERFAFTISPKKMRTTTEVVKKQDEAQQVKKRSTTSADDLGETGAIAVYETQHGRFEILPKGSKGTVFDDIYMTALAEACVYGRVNVVSLLLKHGARDENGFACRICHIVQNSSLEQLILSYHCSLGVIKTDYRRKQAPPGGKLPHGLELHWSSKKLPGCDGEWLNNRVTFYPERNDVDDDVADTGYGTRQHYDYGRKAPITHVPVVSQVDFNAVKAINLDHNFLREVPIELFRLPKVIKIDLSYNNIVKLPEEDHCETQESLALCGWECGDLEELNLSSNQLTKLPGSVWVLPNLKTLYGQSNSITTLLPEDKGFDFHSVLSESMTKINFSHNKLDIIPRFVFDLPNLRTVLFQHNMLQSIPETIWTCISLQDLDVSHNKITSLPWCEEERTMIDSRQEYGPGALIKQSDKIMVGKSQVRPQFKHNSSFFQRHPSVVGTIKPLSNSQELSWSANVPMNAVEGCDYSSLTKLVLSYNRLRIFPEALPCLAPNLQELDISDNEFKHVDIQFIPQSIKKFTARRCKIARFGNVLQRDMWSQVVRNCRHGKTFGMPCQHRSHRNLPCLLKLDLLGNDLLHFQLIHHPPLESEHEDPSMEEGRYRHGVASLDLLYPLLEGLDLGRNKLEGQFNPNIGYQSHLKSINLSKNHSLEKLPMEFAHLKNSRLFTELSRDDCPNLVEPPKEYQNVSLTHLLAYMRSRLKESVSYRTIKLFFIGNGERGKTTLLRRLRSLPNEAIKNPERTTGIDIEEWLYPPKKTGTLGRSQHAKIPVQFLAWDFAGQDIYHTTHQCFYSRRSLYLALFRLKDGMDGVNELEPWLRNVQLRAPGCPVIIVGTHLDAVSAQEAKELEDEARIKYNNTAIYPKIVATATISSTKKNFFSNHMENLRNLIYDVACHLQLTADGHLEHKREMKEDDPKALFSQQIPKSFLDLQQDIRRLLVDYREKELPPILEEEAFRKEFRKNFEDDEEMTEAVYCLNLQGTLLHFEDHGLKNIYFLDPQWLAKLMADVIRPAAVEKGSPIQNGVADVNALFSQRKIPESLRDKYISLLEKFEVALTIKRRHVIIPSLMPDSAQYPKTTDVLCDWMEASSISTIEACYQPPLRRFWMSNYIPDGFWPRLICRIANDHQIGKVLRTVIGDSPHHTSFLFDSASYDETDNFQDKDILSWIPWKTGIAFAHRGRTLLVLKQESNVNCPDFLSRWEFSVKLLEEAYRIEIHVYTDEWIRLVNELAEAGRLDVHLTPTNVTAYATRLLVMVSGHIKSLATNWFPGMLEAPQGMSFVTFMPCWKCYAEIGFDSLKRQAPKKRLDGHFICKDMNPVHCFMLEENIVPTALGQDLECPIHSAVKCVHMVPDLMFWDLTTLYEEGSSGNLHIIENEFLGKGGFGFVCKGELRHEHGGPSKNVAVKIFLQEMDNLDNHSISELLLLSKQTKHLLHAYREIRQEVSFLATLNNPFLTELCGVRTDPYMCLLLELAPKKSLRSMLKEYKECGLTLEPLTLKTTALQIAKGLEYLHQHQVVHLDVKSPNVLVWYFPSAHDSRSMRVRQAGNVWIKIADYGISQVSTGLTLRVGTSPVGTPGFMAPELFDKVGQEISSEKVDVFAYGMTLYELLSFRSPFDNIPLVKRNFEIREKQRPSLQARETRSLVLFQDLMSLCWNQEPEDRPNMTQVREWVESPEFERLRTEVDLQDVKSISCACVCRILPENEEEYIAANRQDRSNITSIFAIPESFDEGDGDDFYDGPGYGTNGFAQHSPGPTGIHRPSDGETFFPPNRPNTCMLVTPSEDKLCIETDRGEKIQDEDDNIYQFVAPRGMSGGQKSVVEDGGGDIQMQHEFDPYTQIWLCGRDQRKGLLQIFTYNDSNVGQYSFSGYCSKDEVTAICPVRNMIWMGTSTGTIMVFHAPTLKTKFAGKLTGMASNPEGSLSGRVILDIRHIPETSSVLIAKVNGEIWSLRDKITRGGLRIEDQILLPEYSPCYHMVKVKIEGSIEVWGTMENNRVLLLERQQYGWSRKELVADPEDHRLRLCSYIVHTSFTGRDGSELSHVWISYRNRSVLVSFDAKSRKQRCILNCADQLRTKEDVTFQVATLVASGRKILVGTTSGVVGIFDSETRSLLNALHWHKDKVRTLLVMPKEMEPCICSEIPFPEKEDDSAHTSGVTTPSTGSENSSPLHGKTTRILTQLQPAPRHPPKVPRGMSVFSYLDNRFRIHNPEPEAVMITSVGNGRRRYHVHEQTRAERLKIFEKFQSGGHRSHGQDGLRSKYGDDVVLLTWKS